MSKQFWLKLGEHFFDEDEILFLKSQQNGYEYIYLWQRLLLKCLRSEETENVGFLKFTDKIPYKPELLSEIFQMNVDVVRVGMELFKKLGMIEILSDGTIYIDAVQKLIGRDGDSTERVRKHRERKKLLQDNTQNETDCNDDETSCNVSWNDNIEEEEDRETDREIEGEPYKPESTPMNDPDILEPEPPPADKPATTPTSGEPPGSPPALTFETKTDLHNRLKYDFVTGSSKLDPGGEPYYHDGKEAGAINELIKRGMAGGKDLQQAYEAIRRKAMILYRKIESPTKTHFADMSFTPSILLAHWNNLKEERPVKPKSRFGASCTPEVMRKLMS